MKAKEMGINIVEGFYNTYESVEAFEEKNWVELPVEIVALLQPLSVKQVIYNAVQDITGGDATITFTSQDVRALISPQKPAFKMGDVDAELRADCVNNPARDRHDPDSSNYDYYWRVSQGLYRLYDPEKDIIS